MPNTKLSPSPAMSELYSQLSRNVPLHSIIEREAELMQYGQISVNVVIKDGVADLSTLNIVKNRRRRY